MTGEATGWAAGRDDKKRKAESQEEMTGNRQAGRQEEKIKKRQAGGRQG